MTEKEFNKLDQETQIEMLKEIDENYADLKLPIPAPIYDKEGNLKNKSEVDKSIKKCLIIFLALWTANMATTERKSIETMNYTNLFINTLKKAKKQVKTMITPKEWKSIVDKAVRDRTKAIKIKQVISGNARVLNKRVQNTVETMYSNGKNYKQVSKALQKEFGYNKNKAKSIAITERNYYKSEAQLQAIKNVPTKKTWVHNDIGMARESHLQANGQVAKNGYFNVGGRQVEAPQHFGDPSEDVNCHCTMRIEIEEGN